MQLREWTWVLIGAFTTVILVALSFVIGNDEVVATIRGLCTVIVILIAFSVLPNEHARVVRRRNDQSRRANH